MALASEEGIAAPDDGLQWEQLDALRERISASRAELDILHDIVNDVDIRPGLLHIQPTDSLGDRYNIVSTEIRVNGEVVHTGMDAWEGEFPPGLHRVELHARIRGSNRGLFTYLSDYEIDVVSAQDIEAVSGERTDARPVAVAREGWAYSFAERPAWWWAVEPSVATTEP
ncbi:MAG: hypothetical protein ACJAZO_004264 [Myxococcota bacterium]|jgi:hypothetical protein